MAQYLILIYEDEAAWANASREETAQIMKEHRAFGGEYGAAIRGGDALEGTGSATSVRRDSGGGVVLTDGPFAETKEALGGYYVIEAEDLDAALAVAKQVPAHFGGVEVRPVRVFD